MNTGSRWGDHRLATTGRNFSSSPAQVAQDVGRIDITYVGPADLSGA